jgi:hypothetical protein
LRETKSESRKNAPRAKNSKSDIFGKDWHCFRHLFSLDMRLLNPTEHCENVERMVTAQRKIADLSIRSLFVPTQELIRMRSSNS